MSPNSCHSLCREAHVFRWQRNLPFSMRCAYGIGYLERLLTSKVAKRLRLLQEAQCSSTAASALPLPTHVYNKKYTE